MRPAGRLGEEMCSPTAEFMCPGQWGTWLFQTLICIMILIKLHLNYFCYYSMY
jgi:hypothetical protein